MGYIEMFVVDTTIVTGRHTTEYGRSSRIRWFVEALLLSLAMHYSLLQNEVHCPSCPA
jgi:hypothetical protein